MKKEFTPEITPFISQLIVVITLVTLLGGKAHAQSDCATPPPGVIGWWRAEKNGLDETGNNPGTLIGDVTYGVGRVGQSFVFSGSSDGVSLGNPANLQLQTFSIEAWIKRASTYQVSLDPYQSGILFSYAWGGYGFAIWDDGRLFLTKNGSSSVYSTLSVVDTNWHHVAVAKSGSRVVFYLDGVGQTADAYDPGFEFAGPVAIGGRGGDFAASFLGAIDELSIYNRALSESEVLSVYGSGFNGKCVGPFAPRIIAQPESRTVETGTDATFFVEADGTTPLDYQWMFNGTDILGATAASLTITNAQIADAGEYAVRIINPAGLILSSNAVLNVVVSPPCTSAPSGIVSWWRGEDSATDEAGGNNGTLVGQATYALGRVGRSLVFDGSGDGLSLGNAANLQLQTFTIEAWIKRGSVTQASYDIHHCGIILSYGLGGYGFAIWDDGRIFLTQNGASSVFAKLAVTDTKWHHVAITKSASNVAFSLDGVSEIATPYEPHFTFSGPVAIGGRGGDLAASFLGCIDELSVYDRALSASELKAISSAGSGGKCPLALPPFIVTAPANQTVTLGQTATFNAKVGGSQTLSYQWLFNGVGIAQATNSSLTLSNIGFSQAGAYAVIVTNAFGSVTSSPGVLTVTFPPALVHIVGGNAIGGRIVTVPIVVLANGNENALGFSLRFNTGLISYDSITLGSGAVSGSLLVNTNQLGSGYLGVAVGLPPGTTLATGTQQVVQVNFIVAPIISPAVTALAFADVPVRRQLVDVPGGTLAATYTGDTLSLAASDFEGDISPRPAGDKDLSIADWVLAGRYSARLDYPTNSAEFQRADCAPRATLGDGAITITDWVQAGRYAAKLDPLAVVGGPESEVGAPNNSSISTRKELSHREVTIPNGSLPPGQTLILPVNLNGQGDENALGLSLAFDPALLSYSGTVLGAGAAGAAIHINTDKLASGRLGFALALQAGKCFAAGEQEILKVSFRSMTPIPQEAFVRLVDEPVRRQVSDANAATLEAEYLNGVITVNPRPSLRIEHSSRGIKLSWPVWAIGVALQEARDTLVDSAGWTNVTVGTETIGDSISVTLPLEGGTRYFRLLQQ